MKQLLQKQYKMNTLLGPITYLFIIMHTVLKHDNKNSKLWKFLNEQTRAHNKTVVAVCGLSHIITQHYKSTVLTQSF